MLLFDILMELNLKLRRYIAMEWVDPKNVDLTVHFEMRHDGPWVYAFSPNKLTRIK